ncbi:MAG: NnrU family protein [Parvularculaceae bacterium]
MSQFLIALSAFLMAHLAPSLPGVRARLVRIMGERAYLASYSILSVILLFWVAAAAIRAPAIMLWPATPTAYWAPIIVMPVAFALIAAGLFEPNPFSVTLSKAQFSIERPGVVALTRHPVLLGFALWAAAHIPPNGVFAQLLFFGGMLAFAALGARRLDKKKAAAIGKDAWRELDAHRKSAWRRSGLQALMTRRTILGAASGAMLYAAFLFWWHHVLFGADPLAFLR